MVNSNLGLCENFDSYAWVTRYFNFPILINSTESNDFKIKMDLPQLE